MDWQATTDDSQNQEYFNQLLIQQQAVVFQENFCMQPQESQVMEQQQCQQISSSKQFKLVLENIRKLYKNDQIVIEDNQQIQEVQIILLIFLAGQQNFNIIQSQINNTFIQKNRTRFRYIQSLQLITPIQILYLKKKTQKQRSLKQKYLVSNTFNKEKELVKQCFQNTLFSIDQQAEKIILMIEPPKYLEPIFKQTEALVKNIILKKQNKVLDCIYQIYSQYCQLYQLSTQQKIQKLQKQILQKELLRGLQEIQYKIFPSIKLYGLNTKKKIVVNIYKILRNLYNLSLIRQKISQSKVQNLKNSSVAFLYIIIMHQLMHYVIRRQKKIKFELDSPFQFQFKAIQKQGIQNRISFKNYMLKNLWSVQRYQQSQKLCKKLPEMQKLGYKNIQIISQLKNMVKKQYSQQIMKDTQNAIFFYVIKLIKEQIIDQIQKKSEVQQFCIKCKGTTGLNYKKQLMQNKIINFIAQSLVLQKIQVRKVLINFNIKRQQCKDIVQKWIKHNLIININIDFLIFIEKNYQSFKELYNQLKFSSNEYIKKQQVLIKKKFQKLPQIIIYQKLIHKKVLQKISEVNDISRIKKQLEVLSKVIRNKAQLNVEILSYQNNQKLKNILAISYLQQFLTYLETRVKLTQKIPEIFRTDNLQLGYILQKMLFPHFFELQQNQKYISYLDYFKLQQLLNGQSYKAVEIGTIPKNFEEQQQAINMARKSYTKETGFDLFSIFVGNINCNHYKGIISNKKYKN